MRAMSLDATGRALRAMELPIPPPGPDDVVLRVEACAVCRTDLHVVNDELAEAKLPLVPPSAYDTLGAVRAHSGDATPASREKRTRPRSRRRLRHRPQVHCELSPNPAGRESVSARKT